jgi:uncharacterized pyridoxamine 5'-phosphate oxidase family protein
MALLGKKNCMEYPTQNERHVVESFFHQHPLMTLATVASDGTPQTAAVYVYFDQDMNGYLVSRESTRKFHNISTNQIAVVSVHDEHVLMFGELTCRAEVVQNEALVAEVLPKLQDIVASRKNDYWIPPVAQMEGDTYVFIKLVPQTALFVNYDRVAAPDPMPNKIQYNY